jgi:hypothetical protein
MVIGLGIFFGYRLENIFQHRCVTHLYCNPLLNLERSLNKKPGEELNVKSVKSLPSPNIEQSVQECDATMFNSSREAGYQKKNCTLDQLL